MDNLALNERQVFVIDDMAKAEWAMKKIAKARKIIQQRGVECEQMIADARSWLENETAAINDDISYFESALRMFAEQQIAGSKKKSFNLPSGKIGFRSGTKKYYLAGNEVKNDNPELLDFVKLSMPELVEVKESVKWSELKKNLKVLDNGKVVTEDGEIVPDMKVVSCEDRFYIDVK